jgi:hypothetical protein
MHRSVGPTRSHGQFGEQKFCNVRFEKVRKIREGDVRHAQRRFAT